MKRTLELIRLRVARTWWLMLALSVIATGFAALWWEFDVMEISDDERGAYDDGLKAFTLPKRALLQWVQAEFGLGRAERSKDVIIVALDDDTMTEVKNSVALRNRYGARVPYDRIIWADLVTYLSKMGARAVLFDMIFNEPSSDGVGDKAFGDAMAATEVPVVLGFSTSFTAPPLPKFEGPWRLPAGPMPTFQKEVGPDEFPEEPTPEEQAEIEKKLAAAQLEWAAKVYSAPVTFAAPLEAPGFPTEDVKTDGGVAEALSQYPMAAVPRFLEATDGFGAVSSEEDEDGKLRRTAFAYSDGVNTYPTLPTRLFALLEKTDEVRVEPGRLTIGTRTARINKDGTAEIHYGGRLNDRFQMVSLGGVVRRYLACTQEDEGKRPAECASDLALDPEGQKLFHGKIVVVGGIAVGTGDSKATPLEQATPALVKQAAVIDNFLHDEFIIAAPFWVSLAFSFFIALLSVALVLVVRNTFVDIGWPVLLYVGFFVVTGSFLVATRIHVLSAMPGLAGTVASILATTWERLFQRRERERLKELFQNYMEADLVELMVEQKELPNLDGENMNVTAFFSDIRGFSTFSEKLKTEPKRLLNVMNRYLSTVTPQLTDEGACIDKYIGDAVVALFGAPVKYDDHPLRACRGALEVQKAIAGLRETFRREGLPDVYTRIGLNTGTMMVGNIGSAQLLDYTAIGDEMNLAARLEGANKTYGTLILMGSGTFQRVRNDVEAREIDLVRVAGKQQAERIYELLAMKGELPLEKRKVVDLYQLALLAYRERKFTDARQLLGEALRLDQTDGPCRRLFGLCSEYEVRPPPADWDAVSTLEK